MGAIGGVIMIIGYLIAVVGSIMIIIEAFKESVLWGIGTLIVPFVGLIFVISNWQSAKNGFLISLGGSAVAILGGVIASLGAT